MKKFLAIMLAAVMVLALAGAVMAEEAPAQDGDAVEFTWNGNKEVWAILPTTGVPGLLVHADSMGYEMEKEGWIYATKDAQGQPASQVEFVEQAIAAGNVGALMIAAMDIDLLEGACAEAREAGIAVTMLGVAPAYPVAGFIATAYDLTGQYAVYTAQDWIEKRTAEGGEIPTNEDGKYEVAVDYYTGIIDGIYRSNAIFGTIEESDNLVAVSATQSYGNSSFDTAYSNAQATLSANPNCRVFICYEPDNAMGIAAACQEYGEINGIDMADFCVIPCYSQDDTFMEMVGEVAEDHSANAIKGYASFGGVGTEEQDAAFHEVDKYANDLTYSATGGKLAAILLGVCGSENYEWDYNTPYYDDITAWNVYGFELLWKLGDVDTAEQYRVDEFLY
ncbi:MAG: sugar ABC transporter substrate-binding protein [Parasporobacterium sp.]|nr:sugar ABC transporter substrate-binding protein [Parasporobacterium sp.]